MSKKNNHQKQAKKNSNLPLKPSQNRVRLATNSTFKLSKSAKRAIALCRPEIRSDLLYMMIDAELSSLTFKSRPMKGDQNES